MAGRARSIGTHGQRPAEKAGNRSASNYCFGWIHLFILFVYGWYLAASAPALYWENDETTLSPICVRVGIYLRCKTVLVYSKTERMEQVKYRVPLAPLGFAEAPRTRIFDLSLFIPSERFKVPLEG